jgi:hypothetical protein
LDRKRCLIVERIAPGSGGINLDLAD